jgi:hypothetical protein
VSAQLEGGLNPIGIKKYLNERLFQHETAIEIMRQMKLDVDVDVDEPESGKQVDFILKQGERVCYVGESKVWKSIEGESEFKENQGIIRELNMLERIKSARIFYLIFTIDTYENKEDNISFVKRKLEAYGKTDYKLETEFFEINKESGEIFEVFYLEK